LFYFDERIIHLLIKIPDHYNIVRKAFVCGEKLLEIKEINGGWNFS